MLPNPNAARPPAAAPGPPDAIDAARPFYGAAAAPGEQALHATPTTAAERLELLDILRGFALLGVLAANLAGFARPFYAEALPQPEWTGTRAQWTDSLSAWFIEGKFYTLFSFLFGYGFALQLERFTQRGAAFGGFYIRRLLILMGIGFLHAILLWWGDILFVYALLGFGLLALRSLSTKRVAIVSLLLMLLSGFLLYAAALLSPELDSPAFLEPMQKAYAEAVRHYREGPWIAMTKQRIIDWLVFLLGNEIIIMPAILGVFGVGMIAARQQWIATLASAPGTALRWALLLLVVGGAASYPVARATDPRAPTIWFSVFLLYQPIALALTGAYVACVAAAYGSVFGRFFVRAFAPAGRMALTNYLLQSVVAGYLFNYYGLAWYDRVTREQQFLLALAIFAGQIIVSATWLRFFRFGPAEWAWRSLTYLEVQPLVRRAIAAPSRALP